uniref:Putative signal peptide protein (Modular protein) n=1 Tax=Ralstonia solanacearum TaxID=305 RepID=A0A0S4U6S5_RALSL|nr:putative signal peptide protein (modular protein) [Ralstonia solanacearum]
MWGAFGCGVAIAGISATTQGATCGTGYDQAAALLNGHPIATHGFNITKLAAAVASYFADIPGGNRRGARRTPVAAHRRPDRRTRAGAGVDSGLPGRADHRQRDRHRHGDGLQPEHDAPPAGGGLAGIVRGPAIQPAAGLPRGFAKLPPRSAERGGDGIGASRARLRRLALIEQIA